MKHRNLLHALKTGAGVEESQLERGYRLEPLIAVLAVVAVRLLSTKLLARSRPESFEAAGSFGPEMLAILEKKRSSSCQRQRQEPSPADQGAGVNFKWLSWLSGMDERSSW
jgi:hypothetical protein